MIGGMDAAENDCKGVEGSLFGDDDGKSMGVDAPQAATGEAAAEEIYIYTMLGQKTSLKTTALKKLMGKRPQ